MRHICYACRTTYYADETCQRWVNNVAKYHYGNKTRTIRAAGRTSPSNSYQSLRKQKTIVDNLLIIFEQVWRLSEKLRCFQISAKNIMFTWRILPHMYGHVLSDSLANHSCFVTFRKKILHLNDINLFFLFSRI